MPYLTHMHYTYTSTACHLYIQHVANAQGTHFAASNAPGLMKLRITGAPITQSRLARSTSDCLLHMCVYARAGARGGGHLVSVCADRSSSRAQRAHARRRPRRPLCQAGACRRNQAAA